MWRGLLLLGAVLVPVVLVAQEPIRPAPRPAEPIRATPRVVKDGGPTTSRFSPKLEAVAETKLLMEGINQANYRGLERLLQQKPADDDTWRFVRGQALLIAEGGNLLMLRPPRSGGQEEWMRRSTDLRETAATLAALAGKQDFERSRAALGDVANACNRCHETFRVPTRIGPEARPGKRLDE
jgi:hypothetical protein